MVCNKKRLANRGDTKIITMLVTPSHVLALGDDQVHQLGDPGHDQHGYDGRHVKCRDEEHLARYQQVMIGTLNLGTMNVNSLNECQYHAQKTARTEEELWRKQAPLSATRNPLDPKPMCRHAKRKVCQHQGRWV